MASFAHFPNSILSDLPDDPAHAMIELEARLSRHLLRAGWSAARTREYIEVLYLWNEEHRLDLDLSAINRAADLDGELRAFRHEFDRFRERFRRQGLRRKVRGEHADRIELALEPIEFTHEEIREICQHLRNIKGITRNSGLSADREDAIVRKIEALEIGIDRIGTTWDVLVRLYFDGTTLLSVGRGTARAFSNEAQAFFRIVFGAKARTEGAKLPPGK